MFARPFIDSLDFSRNCEKLSGEIPLMELPRLADLLIFDQERLAYSLQGVAESHSQPPLLQLSVRLECKLVCQRCLGHLPFSLDLNRQFAVQKNLDPFSAEDADDAFDVIEAQSEMDVLALIEDEVLLSLPYAPKHPEGECRSALSDTDKPVSPFAVLAKLKR